MKNRADQLKTLIFSLLSCLVICWTGTGHAVESWPGKVTAEVNLRRTPGLDGKIFAFLKKGEEVLVREKQDDWYKIIVERETYGYIGWVYGKFVKKAPNEEATIVLPIKEEMERPDKAKDLSAEANISASQSHSQDSPAPQASLPPEEEDADESPAPVEAIVNTPLEESPSVEPLAKNEEKDTVRIDRPQERIPSGERFPIVGRIEKENSPVIFRTENSIDSIKIKTLARFLLKLSPLVLSCLALLFSFNAMRLAKGEERLH